MGRRRRSQERDLEALLARTLAAGAEYGRQQGILAVLSRIARRLLRQDTKDAVRMLEERGAEETVRGLGRLARDVWQGRWREAFAPVLEEIMDASPIQTDRGNFPLSFDLANDRLRNAFDGYLVELSGTITETTRESITKSIQEGLQSGEGIPEIAGRVKGHSDEITPSRATLIARTEATRAQNTAALIKAKESGVVSGKRWLATNDGRTRPEHRALDGVTVGIDEPFPNGLMVPGEPNCRCATTFVVDMEAARGDVA